jgi:hypothetical protein
MIAVMIGSKRSNKVAIRPFDLLDSKDTTYCTISRIWVAFCLKLSACAVLKWTPH